MELQEAKDLVGLLRTVVFSSRTDESEFYAEFMRLFDKISPPDIVASKEINLKSVYSSSRSVVTFVGEYQLRSNIGTSDELYASNVYNEFGTFQEYFDYVKVVYEGAGFTVEQTGEFEMTLDSPTDKSYEGLTPVIESRDTGFEPYTSDLEEEVEFSDGGEIVEQENILDWASEGDSLSNIAPYGAVIYLKQDDEYVPNNQSSSQASSELIFASYPDTEVQLDFKLDGELLFNMTHFQASSIIDMINQIVSSQQFEGINWGTASLSHIDHMTVLSPLSNPASYNGKVLSITSGSGMSLVDYLSDSPALSMGINAVITDYTLKFDDNNMYMYQVGDWQNAISQLTLLNKVVSVNVIRREDDLPLSSRSGNITFPVTIGTVNDFRIFIGILGKRI